MPIPVCHSIESEKTKVCPEPHMTKCLADFCMAWRFVETNIKDPAGGPDLIRSGDTHGYCGKAGDPRGSIFVAGEGE